ncbi:unnamed protein product [Fraxinus pennsylvanica]|uniref:START domain-containing protein n=1 Tax=Fraxinus pennsylvanica TaxID=56036 RepID=A0AAD2E0E8_9LAMI|nr:unnamed protein product [Fraxinus pennsylvanica]
MEIGTKAMDELLKMAQIDAPLWRRSSEGDWYILNEEEYVKMYPNDIHRKCEGYFTDATKKTGLVMLDSSSVVSILMNSDKWAETFPSMIKTASTKVVISSELKMMDAEFQVLSPLVPVRKVEFYRFCKRHDDGMWTVVDTPSLIIHEDSLAFPDYTRLASGCVVQDMPHGFSKVIWVEHVQYGESAIHHLYRSLIKAGIGIGAPRWIATFQRQLHRNILQKSYGVPIGNDTAMDANARRYLLKLAEFMTRAFCAVVCPSSAHYMDENLRITTSASMADSGEPVDTLVNVTTSLRLLQSPQSLFDFLCDKNIRQQWGLANIALQKEYHIATGEDGKNVSLLRPTIKGEKWMLQETRRDELGALVVIMPIDSLTVENVLKGEDFTNIPFVFSGFAIEPNLVPPFTPPTSRGPFYDAKALLLTMVKRNLVVHPEIVTHESMKKYSRIMKENVQRIKEGLNILD